jgi:hypothetical protein
MQTSNDPRPLLGKAAEEWGQAERDRAKDAAQAEAELAPQEPAKRFRIRGVNADLITRLIARQDRLKAERDLGPVRRSIREQVRSMTATFVGGTPTPERNRQAYVEAMATRRNHLGQLSHVYPGTVSAKTIQHRRARGKMAKASRKANRRG